MFGKKYATGTMGVNFVWAQCLPACESERFTTKAQQRLMAGHCRCRLEGSDGTWMVVQGGMGVQSSRNPCVPNMHEAQLGGSKCPQAGLCRAQKSNLRVPSTLAFTQMPSVWAILQNLQMYYTSRYYDFLRASSRAGLDNQ